MAHGCMSSTSSPCNGSLRILLLQRNAEATPRSGVGRGKISGCTKHHKYTRLLTCHDEFELSHVVAALRFNFH